MAFLVILVDGATFASVLFLLSVGLTLIYGVMRILNVSHGGIYALGAYTATFLAFGAVKFGFNPYWTYPMLLLGALIVGLVTGTLIEGLLLRRIYGEPEAIQLLLTFAVLLILDDLIKLIWGTQPLFVSAPYTLLGAFEVGGIPYSRYHLVLVGLSLLVGGALIVLLRRTRFGKTVIAVIADPEMSVALGIDVRRVFLYTFTLGAFCAALGGAAIAPTISVVPGFAVDVIVLSFAVIAIGGMGSLEGAALGALCVGVARAASIYFFPELELVVIYLIMVGVLVFKPEGLFGRADVRRI